MNELAFNIHLLQNSLNATFSKSQKWHYARIWCNIVIYFLKTLQTKTPYWSKLSTFRCNKYYSVSILNFAQKWKMWTLKIQKSGIVILILNQSLISAVFSIVQGPKNRTNRGFPVEPVDTLNSQSWGNYHRGRWTENNSNLNTLFLTLCEPKGQELNTFICSILLWIFWHPWDPWGASI